MATKKSSKKAVKKVGRRIASPLPARAAVAARRKKVIRKKKPPVLNVKQVSQLFPLVVNLKQPKTFSLQHPKHRQRKTTISYKGWEAFLPPEPAVPNGFKLFGGVPFKIVKKQAIVPSFQLLPRNIFDRRPWARNDWRNWGTFIPTIDPCKAIPEKTSSVEIQVLARTRMGRVSGDCARVYTVNNQGQGCVVNVLTETVDANFTVTPNPSPNPPYPAGLTPVVHPFTLGGINHKYKRLYVPSSFTSPSRSLSLTGFYVAVVDVDPTSATYLDTISWIDCGWIPEEIDFTSDNETGVIANYMQGTATIFRVSDGAILAAEVDGFPGAAAGPGEALSRSVAVGNVPGRGNKAFLTLSDKTPNPTSPGLAMINLDSPSYTRTNIALPGGTLGVCMTRDHRRVLTINASGTMHVVKVDQATPSIERTINLPASTSNRRYWAGLAVRTTGTLAFVCTGDPDSDSTPDALVQVNYMTGTNFESFPGLAAGTWTIDIEPLGLTKKPHLFVTSSSGKVTIVPC